MIYLINNGYTLSSHVNLDGGRQEDFLLKPDENESEAHFFLVKAIEEYLRKYTKKIELYNTTRPDIVYSKISCVICIINSKLFHICIIIIFGRTAKMIPRKFYIPLSI